MIRAVAAALLVFAPAVAAALDLRPYLEMTLQQAQLYRQSTYKLVDVEGDFALRLRSYGVVNILGRILVGDEDMGLEALPEDQYDRDGLLAGDALRLAVDRAIAEVSKTAMSLRERNLRIAAQKNRLIRIEGERNPLRRDGFRAMFARILQEEEQRGLTIRLGQTHAWSPEVRSAYPGDVMLGFPKLLLALASGFTSQVLVTGSEDALTQWVVQQPRDSVALPELFRQSLRINKGDVYLTLLTMENILSRHWRIPDRDALVLTRRLQVIHNQWGGGGDKFGFWYHLTGTVLYGYAVGESRAGFAAFVETAGSHVLSGFEREPQENFANNQGGGIGSDLATLVRTRSYRQLKTTSKALDAASYLDLSEDFRDRLELGEDPNLDAKLVLDDGGNGGLLTLRLLRGRLDGCQLDTIVKLERATRGTVTTDKAQNLGTITVVTKRVALGNSSGSIKIFVHSCKNAVGSFNTEVRF